MEELSMLVVKKEFLLRAIDNKNDGDFYADFIHFFNYILSRKFYTEYFTVFTIHSYLKLNKKPKGGCTVVPILPMFSNYSQYGIYL